MSLGILKTIVTSYSHVSLLPNSTGIVGIANYPNRNADVTKPSGTTVLFIDITVKAKIRSNSVLWKSIIRFLTKDPIGSSYLFKLQMPLQYSMPVRRKVMTSTAASRTKDTPNFDTWSTILIFQRMVQIAVQNVFIFFQMIFATMAFRLVVALNVVLCSIM